MAQKIMTITNAGSEGINSDIAPYDLPVGSITSGKNFRVSSGRLESVGSHEDWSNRASDGITFTDEWYILIAESPPVPPVAGFISLVDPDGLSSGDKTMHVNKTAQGSVDRSAELESAKIYDLITTNTAAWWQIMGEPVDNGTYMTLPVLQIQAPVEGLTDFTFRDNRSASDNFGHVRPVSTAIGDYWVVAGRNIVFVYDGGTVPSTSWTDISSGTYTGIGVDGEFDWTSCMIGAIPIINNVSHYPEYWSPQSPAQALQALEFSSGVTWATALKSCRVIRSHKNFLFAMDLTEDGVELPNSYRWSHPADNNGLPFTWDEADLSGIAGKAQIGGDSGKIVDGRTLRDSFVIYSQTAINILDYRGDEFVWERREMSSTIGLLSRGSLTEVGGAHYFIGDGDIYINDGNKVFSILNNKLRRRFNAQVNSSFVNRSFVVSNVALKEIWFCIPEDGSEYPNTAFVFNWEDGSWGIQSLPDGVAHADYGSKAEPNITYSDYDSSPSVTYETFSDVPYGTQRRTPLDGSIVGITHPAGTLTIVDPSVSSVNVDLDANIERISIALEGHVGVATVTRVYPHIEGSAPVNIQIGSQERAGGEVSWSDPEEFDPANDRKLDVRVTGSLFCWRVSTIGTGHFSYSGMDFEFTPAGKR